MINIIQDIRGNAQALCKTNGNINRILDELNRIEADHFKRLTDSLDNCVARLKEIRREHV